MESMDNKEFDRDLKAKIEHFEGSVPVGLWDKIEQELDAEGQENEEFSLKVPILKHTKSIRSITRPVLRYGSIAAMLFIAFTFWKLNETPVVYLENKAKLTSIEPAIEEKKATEGHQVPLENEFVEMIGTPSIPKEIPKGTPELPAKAVYATLKDVETSVVIGNTGVLDTEDQESQVEAIELHLALVPNGVAIEGIEALSRTQGGSGGVYQEPIIDIQQDAAPVDVEGSKRKRIGVSTVLNFLAKGFSNEDGKSIEFSESEEGILQWDIKSSFAKNREGK